MPVPGEGGAGSASLWRCRSRGSASRASEAWGAAEHDCSQSEGQSPTFATGPGRSDSQEQQQKAHDGCDTVANHERLWQRSQVAMVDQIENHTERSRGSQYHNGKDCE